MMRFHCTAIKASFAAAGLVAGLTATASAQNYDAALQVRFGTFLQAAGVKGKAAVDDDERNGPFAYFSKGIGIANGIDLVNKGGWTFGVEIDAAFMDGHTDKVGQQFGVDWIVTARARAGRHVRPDLLWYASTGPALRGSDLVTFGGAAKIQRTRWGWATGTGLEWDYGGGILFGEYLYAGFGAMEFTENGGGRAFKYDADSHMFRLGLKFKIGHDHYHDDVADRIGRRHEPLK